MRLSTQVKPISYVKANAAQIIDELADGGEPVIVTQNGEVKAVVQSIADYERAQETIAFLQIIALAEKEISADDVRPAREVLEELRLRYAAE